MKDTLLVILHGGQGNILRGLFHFLQEPDHPIGIKNVLTCYRKEKRMCIYPVILSGCRKLQQLQ